ncbi:MgtC/SapB family protein [Lapidilactobacillus dextrinicus]|uniref:MgtC/SapB family protein n=1 Tax=Lapidilactobacillus dextrinicus TaxID=51664 RepID=UPI003B4283B8
MGGAIGFEREYKSRPAGMRTHILVCVGTTLLALIQEQITAQTVDFAQAQPKLIQILTADQTRIIAQIVSEIGFLGAGTIIMTKQTVKGLTTAASVWAVAAVGIALGSGLYVIAVTGFIAIMIALAVISYLVPLPRIRRLQVEIENGEETIAYIQKFLKERQVLIENLDLKITRETIEAKRKYLIMFTLTVPKDVDEDKLVIELSDYIEKELCEKRIWLDKEVLYNDAAIAQTMPGVIALNNALLVGKRVNGVIGMLTAGFGSIFQWYS